MSTNEWKLAHRRPSVNENSLFDLPTGTGTCSRCGASFTLSHHQNQQVRAAAKQGKARRTYCSNACVRIDQPCTVCAHPRAIEINHMITLGEQPAQIIKALALVAMSSYAIAHHRLRHVHGIKKRKHVKGRCLVCEDGQVVEVDRLVRMGMGPEEIVSALSTPYPAVCIGRHRRKCLGIPDIVRVKRAVVPKVKRTKAERADLSGLTPEEKRLRHNQMIQARARALRLRVISEYGGACACCGEAREPFLCLDHVDGMGAAHRKELTGDWSRGAGSRTYRWIAANGFPKEGFRILCHNCNCARGMRGVCPHETERARASMGVA